MLSGPLELIAVVVGVVILFWTLEGGVGLWGDY